MKVFFFVLGISHPNFAIIKKIAIFLILQLQVFISSYCTNVFMYLLLKASKVNIQNHPVIKRLYQYRQLLNQMDTVFEEIIKPQIEMLLQNQVSFFLFSTYRKNWIQFCFILRILSTKTAY